MNPEIRDGLDAFGLVMAITTIFCLLASGHDGMVDYLHRLFGPSAPGGIS
jgi:hypothetical protein